MGQDPRKGWGSPASFVEVRRPACSWSVASGDAMRARRAVLRRSSGGPRLLYTYMTVAACHFTVRLLTRRHGSDPSEVDAHTQLDLAGAVSAARPQEEWGIPLAVEMVELR